MTVNDPDLTHTETEVRRTYGSAPDTTVIRTHEVRESNAGWWLAALVAIIAIVAVVFLVTREPTTSPTEAEMTAAIGQAQTQAALENAQSSVEATRAAADAAIARADAATSDANARTEAVARQAAERAAATAEAARDSVTITVPAETEPR